MSSTALPAALGELTTAEEFLEFFRIPYDAQVLATCRLHILQRFHDYVAETDFGETGEEERLAQARDLLARAYDDFVRSDPLTERVFKVLRDAHGRQSVAGRAFVPIAEVGGLRPPAE